MSHVNLLLTPDIAPQHFAGWYILNTQLQKLTGYQIRLTIASSRQEQFQAIEQGNIDLVYANPFDSSELVRQKNYQALASPIEKSNEIIIASAAHSSITQLKQLKKGHRIAIAGNKDIKLIGLRLLEAIDLSEDQLTWIEAPNYQAAARLVIDNKAEATFQLAENYHQFSKLTKIRLHPLIESALDDIHHALLTQTHNPASKSIQQALIKLSNDPSKQSIFKEIGIPKGFKAIEQENIEFMIDIIDTLID
ncbi:PhnD/SsuA/transferrin family substrate-binding protein [Rappaport israeli]|uniref:PhnD/SsuA/transferrin family substrate-binding protein n=1 Tax=Rappaport israeli TaxID=1839807 RepID=UPI0009317D86|nr:PhnD/SsuA/transferrin family substrate-binding protein [Rappaport israeli]